MSVGLPGLGLGGLFFILSALFAPIPELCRTARGRSSAAAWRLVLRQFVQALALVAVVDLMLQLVGSGTRIGLLGITTALLALVVCAAKLAQLALGARTRQRRERARAQERERRAHRRRPMPLLDEL